LDCIEALLSRRSVRVYQDKDVPIQHVLRALDVARYAPSSRNSQPWRFIVVNDQNLLNQLSDIHPHAYPLKRAKIAIVVLAVPEESPTSYMVDASLSTLYIWLALHCMGLAAVWIQTLRNIDEIRRILNIPQNMIPVAMLAVGYPAEKPEPRTRKKLEDIVFINKYGEKLG